MVSHSSRKRVARARPLLYGTPMFCVLHVVLPVFLHAADIEGQIVVKHARDNSDAVVYIDRIPGKRFSAPTAPVVLDQINLKFVPHVLPVLVGTVVAFPNSDEIRHNVFSPGPPRFDLGTYPQKTTRYHLFDKPGVWTMLCNVHAEMSAYVVVAETPYFAKTDRDGKFVLKDVPPGKYAIKIWHEKAKPATVMVEVGSGPGVSVGSIDLKR
jgi:plastocyanin